MRILGLAFLGGLILNLMPCVFPVLFIKGLALVQSSGHERQRMRAHGAMYALGILVSFWAIVALLLLLARRRSSSWLGISISITLFRRLHGTAVFLPWAKPGGDV